MACREMEFSFMARDARAKHCWQELRPENLTLISYMFLLRSY